MRPLEFCFSSSFPFCSLRVCTTSATVLSEASSVTIERHDATSLIPQSYHRQILPANERYFRFSLSLSLACASQESLLLVFFFLFSLSLTLTLSLSLFLLNLFFPSPTELLQSRRLTWVNSSNKLNSPKKKNIFSFQIKFNSKQIKRGVSLFYITLLYSLL